MLVTVQQMLIQILVLNVVEMQQMLIIQISWSILVVAQQMHMGQIS
jgi:hypothetical protein